VEIINARGLHARAAAKVVKVAEGFDAEITLSHDGQTVSATSIMDLLLLAAAPGSRVWPIASARRNENSFALLWFRPRCHAAGVALSIDEREKEL